MDCAATITKNPLAMHMICFEASGVDLAIAEGVGTITTLLIMLEVAYIEILRIPS